MRGSSTFRVVLTALFAALVCVATMFIRVPSPVSGYINLGDGFVLLSAFLLGPSLGTAAAGIGSALADLLSGYPMYAAGTLIIKALMALFAATLCRRLGHGGTKSRLIAAVAAELWMALGYFAYSALCLGYGLGRRRRDPRQPLPGRGRRRRGGLPHPRADGQPRDSGDVGQGATAARQGTLGPVGQVRPVDLRLLPFFLRIYSVLL